MDGEFWNLNWDKIGNIDVLFHEAAINNTLSTDEKMMFEVNVNKAIELFKVAILHECKKIVFASSIAVYGNSPIPMKEDCKCVPLNIYGRTKLMLETESIKLSKRDSNVIFVGLRYSNVYGPGEEHKGRMASMVYQLAQQMKTGSPEIYRDGMQIRDFIYIEDIMKANVQALNSRNSCILNCGTGKGTTFNELVSYLNDMLGKSCRPIYIDPPPKYQREVVLDMCLAQRMIGFSASITIKQGIKKYFDSGYL